LLRKYAPFGSFPVLLYRGGFRKLLAASVIASVGQQFDSEIAPDRMLLPGGNLRCNILAPSVWGETLQGSHDEHTYGALFAKYL
jgi:hypothetical protein